MQACQTNSTTATASWNGSSQAGTPIKTRLKGSDYGFRFLFLCSSPSEGLALDKLYENANRAGFPIDGNNYAFQNMYSEQSGFLYPFLGFGYMTISADLYKYNYKETIYEVSDTNSTLKAKKHSFSLFNRFM